MSEGEERFDARELFRALERHGVDYVTIGDITVPIAHRDDLLKMKRAAGRPHDLADVRLLEAIDESHD